MGLGEGLLDWRFEWKIENGKWKIVVHRPRQLEREQPFVSCVNVTDAGEVLFSSLLIRENINDGSFTNVKEPSFVIHIFN